MGSIDARIPLLSGAYLPMRVDAVNADIPLLVGLDILDREGMVPDNYDNFVDSRRDKWKIIIMRKHGHIFVE